LHPVRHPILQFSGKPRHQFNGRLYDDSVDAGMRDSVAPFLRLSENTTLNVWFGSREGWREQPR
jgi:hypothetical protein